MKTKKIETDLLKKSDQYLQTDNLLANLKEFKMKYSTKKSKQSQSTHQNIHPQSSSSLNKQQKNAPKTIYQQTQPIIKNTIDNQQPLNNKSAIKLPVINHKKNYQEETKNQQLYLFHSQDTQEDDKRNRISTHSKNNIRTTVDLAQDDKITSFLKFMQIKPLKPTQKNIVPRPNVSIHEIKITRQQKSIPQKLNNLNNHHLTPNHSTKKSSSKLLPIKKQQKNQKSITQYQKKSKKNNSLHLNSFQLVRKKKQPTNTYCDFCRFICIVNKVNRPSTPTLSYKAYVGKGNNSILIKNCLKNRFWWNIVDSDSQINLHWTQSRDQKFIQTLKCTIPNSDTEHAKKITTQFILPKQSKQPEKSIQQIQQFISFGFDKFLTEVEKKQFSKNQYQIQFDNILLIEQIGNPNKNKIHNHLQFNWHVCNKKALYYNLKKYYTAINQDPFQYIPLTFHIQKHEDTQWQKFLQAYTDKKQDIRKKKGTDRKKKQKNIWIVKPGENSNQGNGIQVFQNIQEIAEMVKNTGDNNNGKQRSYIIQRYLMPFLYNRRKFDIRCYVLVTSIKGIYKGYWYEEGYIRTSSKQFTIKNLKNRFIHLTNDAVQKKSQDYGKYENGNKISFVDFQKYLTNTYPDKDYQFYKNIYPAMIKRSADAIKSTCMLMDSKKRQFTFEIFGLDFMIDQDFATWLIEVNTNPCLELGSPLLARIIPNMIQNAIKIAIDPLFPPPKQIPKTKTLPTDIFQTNKFTLIFNSTEQQEALTNLTKDTNLSNIMQGDEAEQNHDDIQ